MINVWHRCINPDDDIYETTCSPSQPKGFYPTQTQALIYSNAPEAVRASVEAHIVLAACEDTIKSLQKQGLHYQAGIIAKYAAEIGSPEVDIAPGLGQEIREAVQRIKSQVDPNFFSKVSKIDVLMGGPYGQVSSDDPSVVKVNLPKIKTEVRRQLNEALHKNNVQFDATNPEHQKIFDEALTRGLIEVVAHETGHVKDFKPDTNGGKFPGGEAVADQEANSAQQKLKPKDV